jgi:predicted acylesterase/phospholipase RssA/CRP-like cAMP-binding protein
VTDDRLLLFKSHECSKGLSDEALKEISDAAELVRCDAGEYLHRANEPMTSVYLVVHGRLKQSVVDMHGNELLQRFLTRGMQFGALGAAQAEPVPVNVAALEPSALLRLDFPVALEFTRKHETFGLNLTRLIAGMVRQVLMPDRHQKKPALVAVFHESPMSRPLTLRLVQRLVELGETPSVLSDRPDWEPIPNVPSRSLIEQGQPLAREEIRRQINEWSDSGRIFMDVDASLDPVHASLLVEFSEQVIWWSRPEDLESVVYRLKAIETRAPGWRDKINIVWLLDDGQRSAPLAPELRELAKGDFKLSFSEPESTQSRALVNGFERLVHRLRGIRVGIALGGGAARGMAHLGVLKALEEHGIVVDMIAGTSAGAMTGTLYASGLDADYCVKRFVADLRPAWPFRVMPRGKYWYLFYKYRRGHFDPMLRKYLSDLHMEQLPIPCQSVTVDLVSGRAIVRDQGDAVHSVVESINLPVLSKPICRPGQALIDGGLVNNIPADVLVSKGCNFVIAVSVTAKMEHEFARNRPDTPAPQMRRASTLQTVLRSFLVQSVNMNSVGVQPADVVIEPDVTGFDLSEFSRTDEIAAIGEATAKTAVPKIQELLRQLDDRLFSVKTMGQVATTI